MKLKSKTPKTAAEEFAKYLIERAGQGFAGNITVQDNKVIWEEGPYEWVAITAGVDLYSAAYGNYSNTDPDFPDGVSNEYIYAENINSYSIEFYKV